MFKFFKDKLKGAISKFSQRAEEEGKIEEQKLEAPVDTPGQDLPEAAQEESSSDAPLLKDEMDSLLKEETFKRPSPEDKDEDRRPIFAPIKVEQEPEQQEPIETEQAKETSHEAHVQIEKHKEEPKKPSFFKSFFAKKEEPKLTEQKKDEPKATPEIKHLAQKPKEDSHHHKRTYQPLGEKPHAEKESIKRQKPEIKEEVKPAEVKVVIEPEKKGFFSKLTEVITTTKISHDKFEDLFSDLEMTLLENNVALEVIDKIKDDLSKDIVDRPIKRTKVEEEISHSLKRSIEDLFDIKKTSITESIKNKEKKPFVIAFFGINGSGKTTSIAKLGHLLTKQGFSVMMAAGDTFRAASIEQLEHHGNTLGIKVIKQAYGSDPAAVAFDAIKHAESKNIDVVLIDTAGRLHSNTNLLKEMEKIIRVAKPDLKLFVGESITGNDCVEQAKTFNAAVGIDGLILTKADVDEKGGAAISIGYVTKKPILYLGMGQEYDDLKEFDSKLIVEGLGL